MAKKRKTSNTIGSQRLTETLFCPECKQFMRKVSSKSHQHYRDEETGRVILVTRVFYGCTNSKCRTIVALSYREDGKSGLMHRMIKAEKKYGKPEGLYFGGGDKEL